MSEERSQGFAEAFKQGATADVRPETDKSQVRGLSNKRQADFFVAVRKRGLLNAMMDGMAERYEAEHPAERCRWEYWPPNGDNTFVVAREGQGFHLVDMSHFGDHTASEQSTGPVRRGDMVLMAGPKELVDLIEREDERAAIEDSRLPEDAYRAHIRSLRAQLADGTIESAQPVGRIRQSHEIVGILEQQYELAKEGK